MRPHLVLVSVLLASVIAGVAPAAAQETVTLTVTVEAESGDPVGSATITATWDGGSTTATTASNGKAFVDVPQGADVNLTAESDNYIRNTPKLVENAQERDVTLEVGRKGKYSLRVTDAEGPVEGVNVRLVRDGETIVEGLTNADGRFATPIIERGEYTLRTFKSGYYRNSTTVTVGADSSATLEVRQGYVNVQFQVRDDHFEPAQAVTDARIAIVGVGTQRTTGGTVTFTLPVNSWFHVNATKEGYTANETQLYVATDPDTRILTIQRERSLSVDPANERVVVGERLAVTVTNAYDEPVANATVLLDGEDVATTGTDGQARFLVESAGNHTVTAEVDGVASAGTTVLGVAVDEETPAPSATPSPSATPAAEGVRLPGFTPVTAVLALLALAGVALLGRR